MSQIDLRTVVIRRPSGKSQETTRPRFFAAAPCSDTRVVAEITFRCVLYPIENVGGDIEGLPARGVVGCTPARRFLSDQLVFLHFCYSEESGCKENMEKWNATNMSPLQVSLSLMANCSAADTPPAELTRSPWEPGGNNRAPGMFSRSAMTLLSSGSMAITKSDAMTELNEENISSVIF